MAIGFIISYIIVCVVFGLISKYIANSKGYEGGFAWGFWLWVIGILVVGFRPNIEQKSEYVPSYARNTSDYKFGSSSTYTKQKGWVCEDCGATNPSSIDVCMRCRKYRYDPPKQKCPHCGAKNKATNEKCFACGQPIKENTLPKDISETSTAPNPENADIVSLIEKLAELHEKGILTDEEFQQKKADLLSKL